MQIFWIRLYIVNDFMYSLLIYFNDSIVLVFSNTNIHNFSKCCCLLLNCFHCGIDGEFSFYKCFLSFVWLIFKILPHNLYLVLNKFSKNCSIVIERISRFWRIQVSLVLINSHTYNIIQSKSHLEIKKVQASILPHERN